MFLLGKSHVAQSKVTVCSRTCSMRKNHDSFCIAFFFTYLCLNAGQKEPCPHTTCLGDGGDDDDDDDDYDDDNDDDTDDDNDDDDDDDGDEEV